MDKKTKQRRQKTPTPDELADVTPPEVTPPVTPPGASFDTEAGRAAQGMRPDLGGPADDDSNVRPPPDADDEADDNKTADRGE